MLDPGTRLGPYTIVELLAVGGMGEVYRAEDTRLHRHVAIKVLPEQLADDRASLERFQREARAVASLSHPNILAIFDYGDAAGVQYAVTEMLEGETLRGRMSHGPLSRDEALPLMRAICDGVAAAHARGIIHRDLKPENIFITADGRVKVLDFGLARSHAFEPRSAYAATAVLPTEPGVVLGTIGYMAPEQVEARPITPATDVFSLGCILFELVGGRVPFSGTSAVHAMVAVLHDTTPHLDDPTLDAIVQHCLRKEPSERPQNAGQLAEMLAEPHAGRASARPPRRRKLAPALIAAAVLITLTAALYFSLRPRQIDNGYDLRASDVRGDAETRRLLELALHADAAGNRPQAMSLLEEAARRPSSTPFPEAFLSSFNDAAGNDALAEKWGNAALAKLRGASSYESLLVRYLAEPGGYTSKELALAKSALQLRPKAWRLRLAAAHIHLGQRDRDAARRELQAIDIARVDDRRLMLVLADRASLGDAEGAERAHRSSRLVQQPPMLHYTEARIAWSRGDVVRARALFDHAASEAAAEGLLPLEIESRLHAGVSLIRLGQWDEAQRRLAHTAARARQVGLEHRIYESTALAAYAAYRAGDVEERDRKLAEAAALAPPAHPRAALHLLAMRLGSPAWRQWDVTALARDPLLTPTVTLIRAREAALAGDVDRSRRELRRARAEGIDTAEEREEAELLAAELGLPSTLLPPDPPYPNLLRYLAIFDYPKR
ncbi:MAG TPA: serine/threonine-protein kinase [Thermoanaerobaculia bacterium]|nr:serine/threonine-protein kinase [Thermoanaerobaculia bacterium]